ncbi:MAG: transporter [Thalassolituus sp.]|jgi:predicted permease|nr:MAG: transporter [Thalassolituus sp.]
MMIEIAAVLLPVLVCTLIGACWAYTRTHYDAEFISRLVLNIGAPCLMLSVLSQVEIDARVFGQTAMACVLVTLLMVIPGILLPKALGDDVRTYLPSFLFPNVGNMGLPVCMLAFGEQGLALALAFFMMLSVAHFPVGILLAGGRQAGGLMGIARMPIMYAIAASVLLILTGWRLPVSVNNTVELIGGMTIPLMLITLGVSLYSLKVTGWSKALLYSLVRIIGGLCAGLLVVELLALDGIARGVVLIQSSMPVAVFNYLFAVRYKREPDAVAGLVVTSTFLSFGFLPILLMLLISG